MDNNRKNISLSILDKYAKILSHKQVSRLYESKVNKKYKRMLLEEQNIDNQCSVFVPNTAIASARLDKYEFMSFITSGIIGEGYDRLTDVSYNTGNPQGIWVSSNTPYQFTEVLRRLNELKISEYVEDSIEPREFIQYLYS